MKISRISQYVDRHFLSPGLLTNCVKTIEHFWYRFWLQNFCLFFFRVFFPRRIYNWLRFRLIVIRERLWGTELPGFNTKNLMYFRNQQKWSWVPTRETETFIRNRDSPNYGPDMDAACLKTSRSTFTFTKWSLDESSSGTNFKLSFRF